MLRNLICGVLLCMTFGIYAQVPAGFVRITAPSDFRARFVESAQSIKSIRSDFTQEKTMTMLSEKIVSQGKFAFKKTDKVRMEYQSPFAYLMIINGTKVFIRDGNKVTTISTGSNRIFRQVSQIMLDCVSGNIISNDAFETKVYENKSSYLMEMMPVSKGIKEFFSKIYVYIDKSDLSVAKVQMMELSGDFTVLLFTNKELNRDLPDTLFSL